MPRRYQIETARPVSVSRERFSSAIGRVIVPRLVDGHSPKDNAGDARAKPARINRLITLQPPTLDLNREPSRKWKFGILPISPRFPLFIFRWNTIARESIRTLVG